MTWAQVGNIKGPAGAQGATGAQGPQGNPGVGFTWRGTWSASTPYALNDCVNRTGISYVCTLASTGNDPATDTTHWSLMASSGANAFNTTTGAFTVPASGSTVNVTLNDASWVTVGQMVAV